MSVRLHRIRCSACSGFGVHDGWNTHNFSQKLDVVIDGLEEAWEFFGGVPERVVVDNMKTAVVKADRYEPSPCLPFMSTLTLVSD